MKTFVIVAISLIVMARAQGEGAGSGDAVALVRAMATDVKLQHASMEALALATREGYYTAAQMECFQKLPASAFTAGLAQILDGALTTQEIAEALAFYRSTEGIKYVDYLFAALNKESGATFKVKPEGSDPMTADEMRTILRFAKTEVGKKLEDDTLLMASAESVALTRRVVGGQITACGAKIPGSDSH